MLKFIRGKGHYPSVERQKIQKSLFAFRKTVQHGFPSKPTALAWDPELRLLAIGTSSGVIKILGSPGVEFYGQHENIDSAVTKLFFLPNEGRVISLCDDNSLHLWEINQKNGEPVLEEVKSHSMEGKLKKISACCLESSAEHLLIGTEGGNIYLLDVKTFNMMDTIIYQDVVMYNVPDDYKVNPGAVEAVALHPTDQDKILIGYNRGLMILWDRKNLTADQTYVSNQQLENVCWHHSGTKFMSAHNDGSYVVWSSTKSNEPAEPPNTPYGPFPCKAVMKICWKSAKNGDFIIFAGGMPRASYGDRHTVSIMQGDNHVVLDFTSKVIDFFTICSSEKNADYDNPNTLVVLADEEIVAVDLETKNWPSFSLPYLVSLHSSAITCSQHVSAVPEEMWDKIVTAGKKQLKDGFSTMDWPVNGGKNEATQTASRELLLTGHEDGIVRFWDASGVALQPLYRFSSSLFFTGDEINESGPAADDEEWPPFRKVGTFDPYSDDPRLAVKKIALCALSGTLVVAGTAGQIIVADIASEESERELETSTMNIVSDHDGFVWKGHEELTVKSGKVKMPEGYHPSVILQIQPPAAVLSLCFDTEWGLVAAGTAHGLALFDYTGKKGVISKCTLNPNDLSGTGDYSMSRRKSFKKSLRESFRRLRKGRSQRHADKKEKMSPTKEEKKDGTAPTAEQETLSPTTENVKPVERQVEARGTDDSMASMVRCLYLAKSFIISVQNMMPTLWAGTNSGAVYVFTITVPTAEKRKEEDVFCQLAKEIQLKHRAPVIAITIVDGVNKPLPKNLEVEKGVASTPDTSAPHRVVICSEEQFKMFTLPSLKPFCKYKLTAHEGSRVRKIGFVNFRSQSDDKYSETCVTCLTNQGDLVVVSVPDLRKQLTTPCIKKEDINGISSLVFTQNGEAFYLHSSSELQRISLSAHTATTVKCSLELPEGARPLPEPEKKEEEPTKDEADKDQKSTKEDVKEDPVETTEKKEEMEVVAKIEQPKENNINGETEDKQENQENSLAEITNNSAADITIDSVKDHLLTSAEEIRTTQAHSEVKTERFEVSSKSQQSVTVVTSTTITTNETVVNSTGAD